MHATPFALLLTDDRPNRAEEFRKEAMAFLDVHDLEPDRLGLCAEVGDITRYAANLQPESVSHLSVFGHGTPESFFRPGRWGVDSREARNRLARYISVRQFAVAYAPALTRDGLASLCCCLCSRDPKWMRLQLFRRDVSQWGPQAYRDGGEKSVAAVLARYFGLLGRPDVAVRGHCAAGHTTKQALIREHISTDAAGMGRSLYSKVFPDTPPTWKLMRKWQRIVKGTLARDYLLNYRTEENVINEIRDRW